MKISDAQHKLHPGMAERQWDLLPSFPWNYPVPSIQAFRRAVRSKQATLKLKPDYVLDAWREPKHGNRKRKWHFIIGNSRLALTYLLLSLLEGYDPFKRYPVISFLGQIVPINNQIVPQNNQFVLQKSQFIPLMLYLFSKCVNVIWVQSSDRNMDESIFRTIYIIVRASYVNFTMHCGTMWELLLE